MVCTRKSEDSILNTPEDVGMVKSHVAVPHIHDLTCLSAWNNYWPHRMT
jgi:hypothetical protein